MLEMKNFNHSEDDYALLIKLQDELAADPWKDWESVEMCRYFTERIPTKCIYNLDFIKQEGNIMGWGSSQHNEWGFDSTLLDSTLALPNDKNYLDCAQKYLNHQIETAKKMEVKVLRAWQHKDREWAEELYKKNGFEISLRGYFSELDLTTFSRKDFQSPLTNFKKTPFVISTLKELKKTDKDWLQKFFSLSLRIEQDVPSDIDINLDFDLWRKDTLTPWFKEEDVYIVLDGNKWVALSSYARSDRSFEKISTDLTGVLSEYRRQGICSGLKLHALSDIKKKGFKKVFTGNEENNPMFQINLMLGFKKVGEDFACKLSL